MKRKSRAFTIVELVIVIAVIAILAAVLIPAFSGIIEKANQASDIQLVKNLNMALITEFNSQGITNGKTETAYDSVRICAANGYLVNTIVAKSNMDIAWDRTTGRFMLIDTATGNVVYPTTNEVEESTITEENKVNFFIFRKSMPAGSEEAKYSVFAGDGWKTQDVTLNGVGFDAGYYTGIKRIDYVNEGDGKNVVIRTNSYETSLTVNAPADIIRHYDVCGAVNIIEAHTASYHEYGKVPFIEIAKGRIALEAGAEVEKLHFDATEQKDFEQIIVAADPSVTLPEFSRDEADIKENGTLVVELQKDTNNDENTDSDFVWLYKQGVISQIVVVDEEIEGIEKKDDKFVATNDNTKVVALGVSDKSTETQKAAVEIANNYTGSHGTTQTVGGKENVNVAELDENGDIVTWKINPTHIVDACIHEDGEVYISTTGTNGEGILIIETAEEFEKATAPFCLSSCIKKAETPRESVSPPCLMKAALLNWISS